MVISNARFGIWLVGVSFVLFQFFMQLSSGVVIGAIMHDMQLSALTAGLLGSSLYMVYTCLQIPVGILFDRKNTRTLMAINAFACGLGCLVFAASHNLPGLFLGRVLIGAGSAFAFIGLSHLLREHYPLRQFAFMLGLSETLGFLVTVLGIIGLGGLVAQWGWRGFVNGAGIVGIFIGYLCWKYIPDSPKSTLPASNYGEQLLHIMKNRKAWINGLFVGLSFTIITVFGGLWAIPFIQVKLDCTMQQASLLGAMLFLGAGVSCPLYGQLSVRFVRRKPMIISSCLSTTMLLLVVIYFPIHSQFLMGTFMFLTGICCGAYMLAYSIANELAPTNSLSTCAGFTNTLAIITAPLLQPLTGYLLDTISQGNMHSLRDYQWALITMPTALIAAAIFALFLPEKATTGLD